MADPETVEVAEVLARLKLAEEQAAQSDDPAATVGLVLAQSIIREIAGWPVEDDARLT